MERHNQHHVLFEKRHQSQTRINSKLRAHRGLIIPMAISVHNALHANVLSPLTPSVPLATLMYETLQAERDIPSQLELFDVLTKRLGQLAASHRFGEEATQLHDNFMQQRGYFI